LTAASDGTFKPDVRVMISVRSSNFFFIGDL
jgi:hypothetical protein